MPKAKDLAITRGKTASIVAPTPQNTPLVGAPITQISRPTVPDTISEGEGSQDREDDDDAVDDVDVDLPYVVRRRVEGLKGVHVEYMRLEKEYKKELLELDRKYLTLYEPVFRRRNAITSGGAEPTPEEVALGEAETLKDHPDAEPLSTKDRKEGGEEIKGVPDFWLHALQNHPEISELITERDEKALKSLKDIKLEYLALPDSGYKLTFYFALNDYFTNETLTKTYHYEHEMSFTGDYVYSLSEGCQIDWKEDMDLTKVIELRKQRNKNTNRFRTVKRAQSTPSFFDFFSPPRNPPPEEAESGGLDEAELHRLRDRLELDYQIGEDLKENVVPRAIDYYTGKALEDEFDSDLNLDDGEPEDEWDDDSPSEDDIPVRSRRQVTKNNGKTDAGECKNQ